MATIRVQFSSTQLEYGDPSLVDGGLRVSGWSWDEEGYIRDHSGCRVYYTPPRFGVVPLPPVWLKHATKAIGHGDWKSGWFRPDVIGFHYVLIMDRLPEQVVLSERDAATRRIEVAGCVWSAPDKTIDVYRLLHLHAATHVET